MGQSMLGCRNEGSTGAVSSALEALPPPSNTRRAPVPASAHPHAALLLSQRNEPAAFGIPGTRDALVLAAMSLSERGLITSTEHALPALRCFADTLKDDIREGRAALALH